VHAAVTLGLGGAQTRLVTGPMTSSAVALGAGGPVGIAWEIGVATGLADGGIDVRDADVFLGTSAGSVVAAKLASGLGFEQLFEEQVDAEVQVRELKPPVDFDQSRHDLAAAKEGGGEPAEILRRIGALALATPTVSEAERRDVIASRLPMHAWPARDLPVVAVDVQAGERTVFDAASGVDFVDAVAASCAVPGTWPPVTIGDRRYMDGGIYSTDNADLVLGCDRVLILALRARDPRLAVVPLDPAISTLRASGADVSVVHPDEATEAALASVGRNLLDPSGRELAARAGREQGRRMASADTFASWR
jgi:NTE family protein